MATYIHSAVPITKQDIAALKSGDRYYVRVDRHYGENPLRGTFEIVQEIEHHGKRTDLHYDVAVDARFTDYEDGDTSYVTPPVGYEYEYTAFDSVYPADAVRTLAHFLKVGDRLTLHFIRANGAQYWAERGVSLDQLEVEVYRENAPKDKYGCHQKFVFAMNTSIRDNRSSRMGEMVRRKAILRPYVASKPNPLQLEAPAS